MAFPAQFLTERRWPRTAIAFPVIKYYDDANLETKTLVDSWKTSGVVEPTVDRRYAIDAFISQMKLAGAFSGVISIPYAHAAGAALTNWVLPGAGDRIAQGGITFTVDSGYKADGTSGYLQSGLMTTATPGVSQDSIELNYVVSDATSTGLEVGRVSGTGVVSLTPKNASNIAQGRANNSSTVTLGTTTKRNGFMSLWRVDANNINFSVDGGTPLTTAAASTTFSQVVTLGRDQSAYADGNYQMWRMGPPVLDRAGLFTAWTTYKNRVATGGREPTGLYSIMNVDGGMYPATWQEFGRTVGASHGGTWNAGMRHTVRQTPDKAYTCYSTKNTTQDQAVDEGTGNSSKRRAECGSPDGVRLLPGVVYRGAQTILMRGYGGLELAMGQTHSPGFIDGSPTWAFRRLETARLGRPAITARGVSELDVGTDMYGSGGAIWMGSSDPAWWDVPHDIVWESRYGLTNGYLKMWIDGQPLVWMARTGLTRADNNQTVQWRSSRYDSVADMVAAGLSDRDQEDEKNYWKHGIYASGGMGTSEQLWAIYANVVFHTQTWDDTSFNNRIANWAAMTMFPNFKLD